LRGNELLTTPAVADTAEIKNEPQPVQEENVSIYKFGRSVYKVRTHFNLDCKETLEDVINRLIMRDLAKETL
jgi:hypothetical protein